MLVAVSCVVWLVSVPVCGALFAARCLLSCFDVGWLKVLCVVGCVLFVVVMFFVGWLNVLYVVGCVLCGMCCLALLCIV